MNGTEIPHTRSTATAHSTQRPAIGFHGMYAARIIGATSASRMEFLTACRYAAPKRPSNIQSASRVRLRCHTRTASAASRSRLRNEGGQSGGFCHSYMELVSVLWLYANKM